MIQKHVIYSSIIIVTNTKQNHDTNCEEQKIENKNVIVK